MNKYNFKQACKQIMISTYFLIIGSFFFGVFVASVDWFRLLNHPTIESELKDIEENFQKLEKQLDNLEKKSIIY